MRILVVTGSDIAAETEARSNSSLTMVFQRQPVVTLRLGDSVVEYVPVRAEYETEKFRGLRYDVIIEDGSFNPERSYDKGRWLHMIKTMVLR